MPSKCAIIEYSPYNSYLLPSIIHYFHSLNYQTDLFINPAALSGNFLELLPIDSHHIYLLQKHFHIDTFASWEQSNRYQDYDLLFINSGFNQGDNHEAILKRLRNFSQPLLTWNNFNILHEPLLSDFFGKQQGHFGLINPFSFMQNLTSNAQIVPPIFLPPNFQLQPVKPKYVTLYLDNFTSFQDSGFQELYTILPQVSAKVATKFKIKLFPVQNNHELLNLSNIVKEDDLSKYFIFSNLNRQTNLKEFYAEINKCDCGLLLNQEITSDAEVATIATSLMLQKPLFASNKVYDSVFNHNRNCGFTFGDYTKNFLEDFLQLIETIENRPSLLNLKQTELAQIKQNMLTHLHVTTTLNSV